MVVLDKNEFEAEEEKLTVEDALEQTVTGGRVGSLVVDPESLTMGKIRQIYFTCGYKKCFFKK